MTRVARHTNNHVVIVEHSCVPHNHVASACVSVGRPAAHSPLRGGSVRSPERRGAVRRARLVERVHHQHGPRVLGRHGGLPPRTRRRVRQDINHGDSDHVPRATLCSRNSCTWRRVTFRTLRWRLRPSGSHGRDLCRRFARVGLPRTRSSVREGITSSGFCCQFCYGMSDTIV